MRDYSLHYWIVGNYLKSIEREKNAANTGRIILRSYFPGEVVHGGITPSIDAGLCG